jgi:acyl-[acyl-carrier-protein] desaturase
MITESSKRALYYRAAMEFFEVAERKRNWNLFDDVPWGKIDSSKNSDRKAIRIETYCAEEMYLPDYASHGARMTRDCFGTGWFQARWSFEESRHGLVFREYLTRSGLRSEAQFESLEKMVFSNCWEPPFTTVRRMACYGALQEGATYLAYKAQKERAELEGDAVLKTIFTHVGSDEAAHAGFYRKIIEIEMSDDRDGTVSDFAHVLANFKMPADGLVPRYQERLKTGEGGISARQFMEGVVLSTLRSLGITRGELKSARALAGMITATPSAELLLAASGK